MREIYEKSELRFALIWIGIYVVLMSAADGVSETIGAAKIVTAPVCTDWCWQCTCGFAETA